MTSLLLFLLAVFGSAIIPIPGSSSTHTHLQPISAFCAQARDIAHSIPFLLDHIKNSTTVQSHWAQVKASLSTVTFLSSNPTSVNALLAMEKLHDLMDVIVQESADICPEIVMPELRQHLSDLEPKILKILVQTHSPHSHRRRSNCDRNSSHISLENDSVKFEKIFRWICGSPTRRLQHRQEQPSATLTPKQSIDLAELIAAHGNATVIPLGQELSVPAAATNVPSVGKYLVWVVMIIPLLMVDFSFLGGMISMDIFFQSLAVLLEAAAL